MPRKNQRCRSQKLRRQKWKSSDSATGEDIPQTSEQVQNPDVRRTATSKRSNAYSVRGFQSPVIPEAALHEVNQSAAAAAGPSQATVNLHIPSETSVRATRSQASAVYGKYKNKQCLPNSLVFLSFLHENETISSSNLNLVLDKGHAMYARARVNYPTSVHLATDELPDEVTARTTHYHVNLRPTAIRNGRFLAGGGFPSLAEGLNCLNSEVQYCLLIMAGNCVALFRTRSGHYGYFDPHERNARGLPATRKPGAAIMLTFTRLPDMINRITALNRVNGVSPSCYYEIQPVEFQSESHAGQINGLPDAAESNPLTEKNTGQVTSQITAAQQVTPVTEDSHDDINQTPETMNNDGPSDGSHTLTTSSVREKVILSESLCELSYHNPDTASCETTNASDLTTDSVIQEMLKKISKQSKQVQRKLLRRLSVSQKPLQRRENQKQREKQLYATDENYKSKKKTYSRSKKSPDVRQQKSVYNKNLYRKNATYRVRQLNNIRKSYREKAEYREKQKLYMRTLYRESETFRQKQKSYIRRLYRRSEPFREKQKSYKRTLYRESEPFREKKKSYIRTLYRESEPFKEKQKSYIRTLYRESEPFKEKQKSYIRTLYRESEPFKEKQKSYIRTLYRECEKFRQKQKSYITKRYANDLPFRLRHRELMKELMRDFYNKKDLFRVTHNSRCASNIKRKYRQINLHIQRVENSVANEPVSVCETENPLMSEAIAIFRSNIRSGPTFVCTSCEKASFHNQVKVCKRSSYAKYPAVAAQCLTGKFLHECSDGCIQPCSVPVERTKEWICHTCHDHIRKGSIPRLSVANQMGLSEIPQELKDLNILERHLISKCIPFAKIVPLPRGQQKLIRGNVICVVSELQETIDSLPRLRSESQVMRVKLKRKLCYKGHQLFQTVTWSKLIHALLTLKQIHPQYTDVTIRDDALLCDPTVESSDDDDDDSSMDCDDYDEDDLMQIDNFEQNAEIIEANDAESEQDMSSDDDEQNVQNEAGSQPNDEGQDSDLPNGGFALESCLQPLDISEEILCFSDSVYCVAPAEGNSPVSFFRTPNLEAMAFPVQFPTGQNTLDARRRIKVTPSCYFKSRLFNVDDRFARDPNYLFFAQFVTEIHLAKSSMTVQLRKGKTMSRDGRRITSSMLQNKHEVQRLVRNKDAIRFMQALRGTPAYWQKTTKDLFAMIRQLGTPTFFCTFSAAEMRWSEIITAIKKQQGEQVDFENLDWSAKCEILRSNPVTTMRMFDKRVEALFRDLLMSAAQPLGEIVDYFYRVEFQHRGSPHIHMMLWVQNAPECDNDSDQDVCDFVDRYISAQLPDPETQPELYKKVTEVQKHSRNHTRTCFKNVNSGCRFGFPKPPCSRTMISRIDEEQDLAAAKQKLTPLMSLLNEPEAALLSLQQILARCNLTMDEYEQCIQCMNKKTALILKRDAKDSWINNYNPHLLEAWDSNIDVSFILNAYSCVVYLTKYITKKESGLSDYLTTVISSSDRDGVNESDEMKAVMQAYSKKREVSAQECVTRACGLKMKKCSRAIVFVPTDDNPVKMSRPMSFLENTTPDSCNIWMTSLNDKYKSRPETPEYEEMCLADFAATCRFVSGQQNMREGVLPLLNELGFVQRRQNNKPCVIRFYQCSKEKNPEEFYGRLLRLYLPHRSEEELKSRRFQTYQSYYEYSWVRLPGSEHSEFVKEIVLRNQEKYERYSDDIESALEEFEQDRDEGCDEWSNLAPESDVVRLQCDDQPENQQEDVPDYCVPPAAEVRAVRETPAIDPTVLRQMYQNLNQKQACVFYVVRDWCIKRVCGLRPDPFFLFLHGGAGTGKSHLIKCIHSEASKILSRLPAEDVDLSNPTVLLTAFTGTAAFNIGGTTLHSLLKLPRSLKPPIQGLGNQLDEVRCELLNAEILVIDEISMVSKPLFAYVDARLKQIKGNQKPFGGMSVLAVGDFYQLPPVRQSKPLCVHDPSQIDLWQQYFQMITLTEIMRQKDDVAFAEMLNRIRVKEKTDELSPTDRDMLSRTITEPELCPSGVLHIFATNKDVEAHNSATLEQLHENIITIKSDDFQKDPRTGRMERKDTPLKGGKGDLPDCLKVAEGARVMLTRNINIQDGLVNGAFGKLVRVVSSESDPEHIVKLGLRMDNQSSVRNNRRGASGSDDLVYIDRVEDNMKQRGGVRRQFPVKLAFSCTVHKTQGLTTHAAVVSLKSIFEPGMAYVALSRVTRLSGLYLLGLDETKIYANPDVTAALQSMRQASVDYIMPLLLVREAVGRPDTLTIIHHNTEGLPAHINDIKSHHELCLADVLCLTETHLQGSFVAESLLLDGYNMFKRSRHLSYTKFPEMASRSGGGVAVYVKNHIQVHEKQYLHNVTDLEFLVLKVERPFPALIAVIYRPPAYSLTPFMENLVSLLDSLEVMDCHPVIVCGDFNENQLIGGRKQILEHFQSRGYAQLITAATTDKNTLLDLVFISQPQRSIHGGVLSSYHSYHQPVFCVIK